MAYTTIDDPSAYFKIQTYTGTGSSNAQTFADTDTDMQPDMVWIKSRSDEFNNMLYDSARGVTKHIKPDSTAAQATDANALTAFGSDGFTVGSNSDLNNSSDTYVAWCWKESATAGFDIIAFTGNATARTISHSLSAVPHWMITKNTVDGEQWRCYHRGFATDPETDYMDFNLNETLNDNADIWNDTAPTSSVFSVGTDSGVNGNTDAMIAYLWTSIQGFSKFGSYRGNDGNDGAFVYTGFKPAYVMTKKYSATGASWQICDNKRPGFNVINDSLSVDSTAVEQTHVAMDFCANGFKCRNSNRDSNHNALYAFMAFAEQPFVNSEGVPANAE